MSTEKTVSTEDQIAVLSAQVEQLVKAKGAHSYSAATDVSQAAGLEGVIHLDTTLSDFGIKVMQDDSAFKAKDICSTLNSKHQSNKYYYYEPAYFVVRQMAVRAEGQEAARANYGVARKAFNIEVYALKVEITAERLANADGKIDKAREDSTSFLIREALKEREHQCFTKLMNTDNAAAGGWGSHAAGIGSNGDTDSTDADHDVMIKGGQFTSFADPDSSPLDILDSAFTAVHLKSGLRPNTVVMNRTVFNVIKRNQKIREANQYVAANTGTTDAVINLMATHLAIPVGNIFVLDVVVSTAAVADSVSGDGTTTTIGRKVEGGAGSVTPWNSFELHTNDQGEATFSNDNVVPNQYIGENGVLVMHINKQSSGEFEATAAVCTQWTGLYPDAAEMGNVMIRRYPEDRLQAEAIEINTAFGYEICAPALGMYLADAITVA